jgi:hypothetical protein
MVGQWGQAGRTSLMKRVNKFKLDVAFVEERYRRLEVSHKQQGGSPWVPWCWLFLGLGRASPGARRRFH